MQRLRDAAEAWPQVQWIAISHAPAHATGRWCKQVGGCAGVSVASDPSRAAYARWGLGRTSLGHFLGRRSLTGVMSLARSGVHNRHPHGTRWQTAGTFALDPEGIVRWRHLPVPRGRSPRSQAGGPGGHMIVERLDSRPPTSSGGPDGRSSPRGRAAATCAFRCPAPFDVRELADAPADAAGADERHGLWALGPGRRPRADHRQAPEIVLPGPRRARLRAALAARDEGVHDRLGLVVRVPIRSARVAETPRRASPEGLEVVSVALDTGGARRPGRGSTGPGPRTRR